MIEQLRLRARLKEKLSELRLNKNHLRLIQESRNTGDHSTKSIEILRQEVREECYLIWLIDKNKAEIRILRERLMSLLG